MIGEEESGWVQLSEAEEASQKIDDLVLNNKPHIIEFDYAHDDRLDASAYALLNQMNKAVQKMYETVGLSNHLLGNKK